MCRSPAGVSTPIARAAGARYVSRRALAPREGVALRDLPSVLEIPTRGAIDAVLRVPGSKSITNRALLIAALASGESQLSGGLESDDTLAMIEGLTALGCEITLGAASAGACRAGAESCSARPRRSTRATRGPPRAFSRRRRRSRTEPS